MLSCVMFTDHWYYNSVGRRVSPVRLQWLPPVPIGQIFLSASLLHRDWCYYIPDIILRVLWSLHGELHDEHGGE